MRVPHKVISPGLSDDPQVTSRMPQRGPRLWRFTTNPASLSRAYWLIASNTRAEFKACCVVAGHLALRLHAAMLRGAPYQLRHTDGTPITPDQARQIIAANWIVPDDIRQRRRSRKNEGRTPQQATRPGRRGGPPTPGSPPPPDPVNPP
jgi:hypothetical protein